MVKMKIFNVFYFYLVLLNFVKFMVHFQFSTAVEKVGGKVNIPSAFQSADVSLDDDLDNDPQKYDTALGSVIPISSLKSACLLEVAKLNGQKKLRQLTDNRIDFDTPSGK